MATFEGQVAFITGASSGIGQALARELARCGADIALAARRTDRLRALAAEIAGTGRRTLPLTCDVTRDGDLERAVADTRQALGRIDVAVANAGFGVVGCLDALTLADYRRQFETNVFGVLRTIYAALDELERTRGRLVLIGSVAGYVAVPGGSAYSMSKFAVRALAETIEPELAGRGISVTLVSPGFVESEIHQVDNEGRHHPETAHRVPWLVMPVDRAARRIVRAVARRRREIVLPGHARASIALRRFLPGLLRAVIRRSGLASRGASRR